MGFNSAFKGLKVLKNPGNGRLNNLNDPVLNVLSLLSHSLSQSAFVTHHTGTNNVAII